MKAKGMNLFCSSPASTAICSSMEQRSMVRHGTRPIDHRHNPHLQDQRRSRLPAPCSSQLPINLKHYHQKSRKSSAKENDISKSSAVIADLISPPGSSRYLLSDTPFFDFLSDSDHISALVPAQPAARPRQISSINDSPALKSSSAARAWQQSLNDSHALKSSSPRARDRQLIFNDSPALKSSSPSAHDRQLSLNNSPALKSSLSRARKLSSNGSNDSPVLKSSSLRARQLISSNDSPALKSSSSTRSRDQVVVLWVSLHCKGCEGKVRKHISRMEGVTSFSIDLATKKVTIIGDVTPLGVLESVSKVKNAQLWPSPASSSSSPSSSMVSLSY